ncbi:MurR/RpiR family transcriptional regulator [Phaeobacter sp. J2-8]|uniref:MurR/RpiR family transcriptional regulator n=1 Tax=Phaeobacter sp. J2-8 TaxID=2931394 RepID=UPI001FD5E803|nr:MurR/RpiR family transcriptional regulator [Phaeobacter sp. J2-8]MCJ7874041.1 MurR/RpiR family transcriptional regulator [Phaeobacter sp. J2-8]
MTQQPRKIAGLHDLVSRNSDRLTGADSRLLDVLMRDPVRAAMENGKEVSNRAGVHPASAIRLARRLGFDGYPAFRSFLQNNLVEGDGDFTSASARMAARLVQAEEGGVLSSVIAGEIAALEQLRDTLSDPHIRTFSTALRGARRIFVFGQGHAASLASLIALRLGRSGYNATDLGEHANRMSTALTDLNAQDVIWALSFRGPKPTVRILRDVATTQGATFLALTDVLSKPITPAPDHLIQATRGRPGESQSLVVPMSIANAIILDLAGIDEGRSLRALENYRKFRGTLPDPWQ